MIPVVSNETMRFLDEYTMNNIGIEGIVLMENAGKSCFDNILNLLKEKSLKKVAIFAGKGNNGGDGFVISRYLFLNKIAHDLFLMDKIENYRGDAAKNLAILLKLEQKISFYSDINFNEKYDLAIDALLGTGIKGDIIEPYSSVIQFINASKTIVAIDIPSGINGNTGCGDIYVNADFTYTIVFPKLGFYQNEGLNACGIVKNIDISIPKDIAISNTKIFLSEIDDFRDFFPKKIKQDKHKGNNGHLVILAGSKGFSGAAIMCAKTAYKMGAGLVTAIIPESINTTFETNCIEEMSFPVKNRENTINSDEKNKIFDFIKNKANALIIGPGLGVTKDIMEIIVFLLTNLGKTIPILIDADGLNNLSGFDLSQLEQLINKENIIITPHPGEFFKLFKRKVHKRIIDFQEVRKDFQNVNFLLKGKYSLLSKKSDETLINCSGSSNLAKGGSGDMLSGIIGALLAKGFEPEAAMHFGAFFHGYVADVSYEKSDEFSLDMNIFLEYIPKALKNIKIKNSKGDDM